MDDHFSATWGSGNWKKHQLWFMISQYVLKTYTIPYNHQPIYIYIYWYNPNIDIVPIYIYILIYIYISSHLPNPATSHVAPPQAVEGGPAAFVHDGPRAPKACCGSHRKKRSAPLENHRSFMGYHHIITISSSKLGIFVRFRVKNGSSWEKSKWENTTGWLDGDLSLGKWSN